MVVQCVCVCLNSDFNFQARLACTHHLVCGLRSLSGSKTLLFFEWGRGAGRRLCSGDGGGRRAVQLRRSQWTDGRVLRSLHAASNGDWLQRSLARTRPYNATCSLAQTDQRAPRHTYWLTSRLIDVRLLLMTADIRFVDDKSPYSYIVYTDFCDCIYSDWCEWMDEYSMNEHFISQYRITIAV